MRAIIDVIDTSDPAYVDCRGLDPPLRIVVRGDNPSANCLGSILGARVSNE